MRTVMTLFAAACVVAGLCGEHAFAQAAQPKALQLKDLPASVQKTVEETLKGGAIKHITKEKEDGIEQYEIESTFNGKARDFNVATDGRLLVVEEATTLDAIPGAAKAAIQKRVGVGTVTRMETFAKPGKPLLYEAAYKDAKGKRHEVLVEGDGKEVKD
jgi:NAD(P)H-hydrate repair Nnr-like enzyme with NAD(P)H-hydrate dehydratase domain